MKNNGRNFTALLIYVDDLLFTGNCEEEIKKIKSKLHRLFTVKDLGQARYFLGLEIIRGKVGMHINQSKYILDILSDAGLLGAKPFHTPLPRELNLTAEQGKPFPEPEKYRRLIGRMLYLNFTRPDISYAVQQLSQFVGSPTMHHWNAALHVL